MSTTSVSIELAVRPSLPPVYSSEVDISSYVSEREDDDEVRSTVPSTSTVEASDAALSRVETSASFEPGDRNVSCLAPVDGGIHAWSFMIGAFVIETFVWGLPNSFGVFLSSYLQDTTFSSQPHAQTILPLVGTLSSGIMYCSGLLLYPILARYPKARRVSMWIGLLLCWVGLFAASFATKISTLLLSQGIVYGIGGSLLYAPIMSFFMEWFVRRRGFASGVINAGTAVGGLTLPPILPRLIDHLGRAKTLRYISFAFALIALILPVMKPRLPEGNVHGPRPGATRSDSQARGGDENEDDEDTGERTVHAPQSRWSWATNLPFQLSLIASTVQALAYYVPVLYLPSFASSLGGLDAADASLTVALLNGASLASRITLGMLSDRLSPFAIAMLCAFGTALVTFLLWGVVAVRAASHFSGLLAFGIAYGALAGGWTSLMVGFVRPVSTDDPRLATNLIGLLYAVQGVGNILSTPISTSLFHSVPSTTTKLTTSNTASHRVLLTALRAGGYEKMIVYVGSCFAGAGVLAGMGMLAEKSQLRRGRGQQRPWQ